MLFESYRIVLVSSDQSVGWEQSQSASEASLVYSDLFCWYMIDSQSRRRCVSSLCATPVPALLCNCGVYPPVAQVRCAVFGAAPLFDATYCFSVETVAGDLEIAIAKVCRRFCLAETFVKATAQMNTIKSWNAALTAVTVGGLQEKSVNS